MKRISTMLIACIICLPLVAQEPAPEVLPEPESPEQPEAPATPNAAEESPELSEEKAIDQAIEEAASPVQKSSPPRGDTISVTGRVEVIESPDKTRVTLGKDEVIIVEENGDTVVVGLGSRGISIVEGDEGVVIKVLDMDEERKKRKSKKHKRFDPHWAGFEVGLNNYLTPDNSLVLPPGEEYMDLNTGKSWNWNINFVDFGVGLGTPYVGLTSGLGVEFINYNFDGQNSIMKDPDTGEIVEYVPDYAGYINKSKMNITYLTAPILLEFHIPAGNRKHVRIIGGVIGGVKLWSNTKVKYRESGEKSKEKNKSDFNLSPLRWGATARVGYGPVNLFANYYMTPLFKDGQGPELHPFTVGLALTF